jgi:NAD(P)-dependent dehydrogenase (short-subunit alcohol dehydrogenase family)
MTEAIASIPSGRVGSVDEVADATLFLARAGFITGQTLYVDGAHSLAGDMWTKFESIMPKL